MQTDHHFIDIREEAQAVVKTVLLLDRAYTATYLGRVLRADEARFPLRNEAHRQLESYGELKDMNSYRLENLIDYLVGQNYLQIKDLRYGTLAITERGIQLLRETTPLEVDLQALRRSWHDVQLEIALKEVRKSLAEAVGKPLHTILTNFSLKRIVRERPETPQALRSLIGCKHLSTDQAEAMVAAILDMNKKMQRDELDGIYRRVYSRRHQHIKRLLESGRDVAQIAEELELEPSRVRECMSDLHRAAELDLSEWIEHHLGQQDLHRGAQYFKQATNPKLKEAREVLGMDYDKLHMCRAYATRAEEAAMSYPG